MWIWCFYIFITLVVIIHGKQEQHERQRRHLIFTPDTQYGVLATVSIPLYLETAVNVAWFIEANYYNVDNATYFRPLLGDLPISRKQERSAKENGFSRRSMYIFIENMLQKHGYRGQRCLLRAICENATSNFLHNGLLGDLLHLILTPSTSRAEDTIEDIYYEAEFNGLENDCIDYTYGCPSSPLDLISVYIDEI